MTGTLAGGPWAPPITINGVTETGNALQLSGGEWVSADDELGGEGTLDQQGFPFLLRGPCVAPEPE
jgi:hypothetical protein